MIKAPYLFLLSLIFTGLIQSSTFAYDTNIFSRIGIPESGKLYHGVFPPRAYAPNENDFRSEDVISYEKYVGKKVTWVYFSHDWFKSRYFPTFMCKMARSMDAVPYIRLMTRTDDEPGHADKKYLMQYVIDGKFDAYFNLWAIKARDFNTPIIVEWGTECNEQARSWNGKYNAVDKKGRAMTTTYDNILLPDGPEEFAAAYRHIVKLMRDVGATNITWVFHIAAIDNPYTPENAFEVYYPGDDYIDWIGVSAYGSRDPAATEPTPLADMMNECYPRIQKMAKNKPIVISEFGCTSGTYLTNDKWAETAFKDIFSHRWPDVIGFSWWNENWQMKYYDDPTTMRLQDKSNGQILTIIRKMFQDSAALFQETPVIQKIDPPKSPDHQLTH
jgi:hypothetical protein